MQRYRSAATYVSAETGRIGCEVDVEKVQVDKEPSPDRTVPRRSDLACAKYKEDMTTKRSKLRKGAAGTGKTVARSSNTRAKRKAVTATKMARTAAAEAAAKKAAKPAAAPKKAAKKAPAKAAKK